MSTLTKPYTFAANTYIVAAQVNSDFDTLYDWVNTKAIWADASVAFTGVPSGPGADPTSANQLTRKQYVDDKFKASGTAVLLSFGTVTVNTDAQGGAYITLNPSFPNGTVLGVVAINSNYQAASGINVETTETGMTNEFGVKLTRNNVPLVGGPFQISYIAWGT